MKQNNKPSLDKVATQLMEWLHSSKFGRTYKEKDCIQIDVPNYVVKLMLFTSKYQYYITATPKYLGCMSTARQANPGETWMRGSDLEDGSFTTGTWNRIMGDIVSSELVKIAVPVSKMMCKK